MIRLASGVLLLLALALPLSAADCPQAYDLCVDRGHEGALKLRLWVELGGKQLASVEGQRLQLDANPARQPHGELLTRALVDILDRDHDGKLTKKELEGAEKVLLERDADEDECLTPFELAPALLLDEPPGNGPKAPLVTLSPTDISEPRPLGSGGGAPNPSLTVGARKEWSEPRPLGSGWAQAPKPLPHGRGSEAQRREEARPDQEITVRLGDLPSQRLLLRAGTLLIDVATQTAPPAAAVPPRRKTAAHSLVTVTASGRPRSWFVLLDVNGDGQLSRKELRRAWEQLADAEARQAGFVPAPDWAAPVLTLTFVRGARGATDTPLLKRPARGRGPCWFQAMDRNGDGCVSPWEFIGTARQFEQLDRDGDGLLGPEEAEVRR